MGFFKKRTFKSVGKDISLSIKRQKQKEKIARTLEKEEAERKRERDLNIKIKELKARRPSFTKSAIGFAKRGAGYYRQKQKESLTRERRRGSKPLSLSRPKPLSVKDLI